MFLYGQHIMLNVCSCSLWACRLPLLGSTGFGDQFEEALFCCVPSPVQAFSINLLVSPSQKPTTWPFNLSTGTTAGLPEPGTLCCQLPKERSVHLGGFSFGALPIWPQIPGSPPVCALDRRGPGMSFFSKSLIYYVQNNVNSQRHTHP